MACGSGSSNDSPSDPASGTVLSTTKPFTPENGARSITLNKTTLIDIDNIQRENSFLQMSVFRELDFKAELKRAT